MTAFLFHNQEENGNPFWAASRIVAQGQSTRQASNSIAMHFIGAFLMQGECWSFSNGWREVHALGIGTLTPYFHDSNNQRKRFAKLFGPKCIRNLTDFRRPVQYCSFPPVNPAKISHQACRLPATTFARSKLMSWLGHTDLAGYPNKPVWNYECTNVTANQRLLWAWSRPSSKLAEWLLS